LNELPPEWKKIDVLVNNAGLALGLSTFFNGNMDHWDTMMDTNVKGLLYVSRAVSQGMIARKSGHIINIGSIAGKEVYMNGNVYCASKHAVDALSKAMRIELAEYGIRVGAVHPGAVETEFSEVRFEGDTEKAAQVYKGFENLVAEDIADAVFYMASRKPNININDLIIMPQAQPVASIIHRK
jgi:NADP-dependent 3-hydroxy acid dehydrogenase YdfG